MRDLAGLPSSAATTAGLPHDLAEVDPISLADLPPDVPGGIPVLRPQLPRADDLLPYLRRIDATRVYSNWGPLATELEERLCARFGLPAGGVVSASSGTTALVGAILAAAGRATADRPVAILPAFTFVATAIAAEQCGYEVQLADIDPITWMLDPERLGEALDLARVGLVVPVAPYGRPVPQEPWRAFRTRTGLPVVIDGAAMFEAAVKSSGTYLGEVPVAMSFHATKSFSTGEGGCVATTDVRLAERTTRALNFGFFERRNATSASINGKMSEYHAAVGLAELDVWSEKQEALHALADCYRNVFREIGPAERLLAAPEVASVYILFRASSPAQADRLQRSLLQAQVSYRIWYGGGLHRQAFYAHLPREPLPVTDALAPLLLGLPAASDLPEVAVRRVGGALLRALETP